MTFAIFIASYAQQDYIPAPENLEAREWFRDAKFGLFVHWGVYSVLGDGEWVMEHTEIPVKQYERLPDFFIPVDFDPAEWVGLVKETGMKYITITSKHCDGFAMFDSKISDYDIVDRTPYGRDVLKMLAEECRKQGIRLFFYYAQLDWHHPDFYAGGSTGGAYTGRGPDRDWSSYLAYMNTQIRELLSNYGDIAGIWLDGWWDKPEADWQLEKTYELIHSLQPACMIGNNRHVAPLPGEDFLIFEKYIPRPRDIVRIGDKILGELPLETCQTVTGNGIWAFSLRDRRPKSVKSLLLYLIRAAGHNCNFLLNVGPMPNGKIQPEHVAILKEMGTWMDQYGETIYGTRGGPIPPKPWGVTTQKENKVFVHILDWEDPVLFIPDFGRKIQTARCFKDHAKVTFTSLEDGILLQIPDIPPSELDLIIELEL